jgi:hypothetical protein
MHLLWVFQRNLLIVAGNAVLQFAYHLLLAVCESQLNMGSRLEQGTKNKVHAVIQFQNIRNMSAAEIHHNFMVV